MRMTIKMALAATTLSVLTPCGLIYAQAADLAGPPTAAELQPLQGTWEDGKITITITGDSLHFYRDADFWFETKFTLPAGTYPQQLHATIKDCPEPCDDIGKVVFAIFKIEDGTLTLAGIQASAAEPPKTFGEIPGFEDNRMFRYKLKKAQSSILGELLVNSSGEPAPRSPVEHVYAQPNGTQLKAHVFAAQGTGGERRPAIVLFHGGGWTMGEPAWAFARAQHFAERGMVAVAVQYRLSDQKEITPYEAMADARAAIRWVRVHADSLGVDPKRVVAFGWSAGAHLAASAAIFEVDSSADSLSTSPNALVLVSPAVSLVADSWAQQLLKGRGSARDISPDEHVRKGLPPTLILQGDVDTVTPMAGAKRFCERMRAAGNVCELHVYEGFGHLFTPAGTPDDGLPEPDPATSADALTRADRFLESRGFLK